MVEQSDIQSKDASSNLALRSNLTHQKQHQHDGFRGRMEVRPIDQSVLEGLVQKYHYSKVMPRLTKLCLGGFVNEELVIGASFGWGRRPQETVSLCFPKSFPALKEDKQWMTGYYEIGKMCGTDAAPPNTESCFIGGFIRWFKKNDPDRKVIFTWADGLWGKPGYVYQSSNFLYGGEVWTDRYIDAEGHVFNPSQLRAQSIPLKGQTLKMATNAQRKEFTAWRPPSLDRWRQEGGPFATEEEWQEWLFAAKWVRSRPSPAQMRTWKWRHILGQQFRYAYLLRDTEILLKESPIVWTKKYPKGKDLKWKEGKTVLTVRPVFRSLNDDPDE